MEDLADGSPLPICETCRLYLFHESSEFSRKSPLHVEKTNGDQTKSAAKICCWVCFNLWRSVALQIPQAIHFQNAYERPHRFSRHRTSPTFRLPGEIAYRYRVLFHTLQQRWNNRNPRPVAEFVQDLKHHVRNTILQYLDEVESTLPSSSDDEYPPCLRDEELGYLCLHVVLHTDLYRPASLRVPPPKPRKTRKQRMHPELLEVAGGGDPRVQFEQQLAQEKGIVLWSTNQACDLPVSELPTFSTLEELLQQWKVPSSSDSVLSCYATVWRRPFYIRSLYTKISREISQTPFFVTDRAQRRRLGLTSVEEVLTPYIVQCCHGIVVPTDRPVHGRAKFHASGREDMDVRMLLPVPASDASAAENEPITGRPFVYEIIDARQIPSQTELQDMVRSVNHFPDCDSMKDGAADPTDTPSDALLVWDRLRKLRRSYGNNPLGVDISSDISLVPSRAFQLLQEETEHKIKHYECYCWCERPVAGGGSTTWPTFPLEIQQATPIRVLHRRSNLLRTRTIWTCTMHPIIQEEANGATDSTSPVAGHFFRLRLSTSAGTYVKEFVHGDLGRTQPNLSTFLGGRTDILELDCTGIQS